jgi:hypothetical protein
MEGRSLERLKVNGKRSHADAERRIGLHLKPASTPPRAHFREIQNRLDEHV